MKKTIAVLLALVMLLPLAACGGASDPAQRPAGGSSAPDEQPSAEPASPQATEAPHALAEDCFFALSGPNSDPRLLFEALASD